MAVLCFVPFPHYDLAILQMLPGGTDSLYSLHRKVGAPSQTRRHESVLSENALSFRQLSRGPFVCLRLRRAGLFQLLGSRTGFQVGLSSREKHGFL